MSQLVILKDRQAVTTSLQVAENFGKNHRDVLKTVDELVEGVAQNYADPSNGRVVKNSANLFYETTYTHEQNKQQYRMYYMNRDGFTLLAMGFTGSKALQFKLKYIDAFNQMEQKLLQPKQDYHLPQNFKEALIMLAETVDENDQLKEQIEEDKEKVVLANAVTSSDEGMLIEAAAKYMRQNGVNIGRDRLFKWLRGQGYLVSRKGREWNMPTQKSLNQGLMKIHCQMYYDYEGELKTKRQVVVTGKGLLFFINKFLHDGQIKLPLLG